MHRKPDTGRRAFALKWLAQALQWIKPMQRNYGHVPRWARRLISAIERAPRHRCRASRDVIDHGPWMSYESRPARSRFARGTVPPAFDTDDPTLELEETPTVEIEC